MEVYEVILKVVEFVEENIKNDLTQEMISKKAAFSKYHLHRLFKSITGKNLMEYVRSRKITLSLDDLLNSRLRVEDIALEYGFSVYSAYSRAFKKEFGISPDTYRKNPCVLPVTEKISKCDLIGAGTSIIVKQVSEI